MKKLFFIVVLLVLALLSAAFAKRAEKLQFVESKCRKDPNAPHTFRESCIKSKPKPKPRTKPVTPKPKPKPRISKPKIKCWRVNHKGKRVGTPKRCPRTCNRRKINQRYIAKMKKHRESMKKAWFYLTKLEKRLSSRKTSFESITKRKHEKYVKLAKSVETLKGQVDSAQTEFEKLKKVVDGKEQGYEKVIDQLKTFEKQYESIRTKYLQHVRNAENLYAKYQKSLSSKNYLSLKAELEVLSLCKSKMSWLKRLVNKYVRVKTIYKKQYIFLYKNRKVLIGGKCVCPVVLRPVCGKDGVTYSSRCVARCASAKVDYSGVCKCNPTKPTTTKPVKTTKPRTNKPKTNKPTSKPKTTKPKTTKPKTTKPKTTKPKTTKPKTIKPKTNKPRTNKPKTTKPKTVKPVEKFTEVNCSNKDEKQNYEESCDNKLFK